MRRHHAAPISDRPRWATGLAAAVSISIWAIFATATSARAQSLDDPVIDVATVSCRDLMQEPLPQALVLVGWLGGYVSGLRNENRVDRRKFIDGAERVLARCRENETLALIEVAKQELGGP